MLSFRQDEHAERFAEIILPLNLPQTLTYGIPADMQGMLKAGMRVEVALGNNKLYAGIVAYIHSHDPGQYNVKPIRNIIDDYPIVNKIQLEFWKWIEQYYIAAPGGVMNTALPAHLKLAGETRLKWIAEPEVVYDWTEDAYKAAEALELRSELLISELRSLVGSRKLTAVINELLEQEAVEIYDELDAPYKPKKEKVILLHEDYQGEEALHTLFDKLQRAPKQLNLLMAYIELSVKNGVVRQQDLLERANANALQIRALVDKGIFTLQEVDVDRLTANGNEDRENIVFTEVQSAAFNKLNEALEEKDVVLLQGVTGSGKTLLYIEKIRECIAAGKQAVLLLPEIGLTTQLVNRLYAYFGDELGVYHSRFSNNERVEIWEKVRKGTYKVVAGPRSVLWLPYNELGLIIVDEEHDVSYKQKDPSPRFQARDAAIYLATLHHAKVILGSATPSVESLYNAKQNKYGYVQLEERYKGIEMPAIEIINSKSLEMVRSQHINMLTPELQQAMSIALANKRQIILFQNRRGYSPFQICTMCGWVPQCKNCAVSLTYHKSSDKLHCHYCGQKSAVVHTCPSCGGNRLQSKSFGTEKIEEEVQQVFPEVRVARMDVDSMRGKQNFSQLLSQLEKHKIDVLVGTQMVVKGLDFAGVSVVGILSADSLLNYPDFRVNERAFQLMEQVSGRAGRTDGKGEVLIQAYNTQHPVLKWVQAHDINAFYIHEITARQQFGYPPFVRMIKIIFKHKDEPKAIEAGMMMMEQLKNFEGIIVNGPVAAIVSRVRNQYVQEVWIKCPRDSRLLESLKQFLKDQKQSVFGKKGFNNLQVIFDVDPY